MFPGVMAAALMAFGGMLALKGRTQPGLAGSSRWVNGRNRRAIALRG